MLNLLKYELKKRKSILIVGAIILTAAEGLAIYLVNKSMAISHLAAIVLFLMFFGVIISTFFDVAIQYYNDFKKEQGTMLFLTPNSGYKIVGSKMIFGAVELLLGLGIVLLFSWITNSVAINLGYTGIGPVIKKSIELITMNIGETNAWWVITLFVFLLFLQYLAGQSIVISSITIGRTIMSRNSYNWLWAVLLFIGVSIVVQLVNGFIIGIVGINGGLFSMSYVGSSAGGEFSGELTRYFVKYFIIGGVQYVFWIIASFFVSSNLLNKKIDI